MISTDEVSARWHANAFPAELSLQHLKMRSLGRQNNPRTRPQAQRLWEPRPGFTHEVRVIAIVRNPNEFAGSAILKSPTVRPSRE